MLQFKLGPQQIKRILKLFLLGKLVENTLYTCNSDYLQLSQVLSTFSFQCPSEEEHFLQLEKLRPRSWVKLGRFAGSALLCQSPVPKPGFNN